MIFWNIFEKFIFAVACPRCVVPIAQSPILCSAQSYLDMKVRFDFFFHLQLDLLLDRAIFDHVIPS